MVSRLSHIALGSLACLFMFACSGESTHKASTPEIQSKKLAQLSAGGGTAGYDFYVGGHRVGALIVTNGAFDAGAGYYDQKEYWRWKAGSLADIESGTVSLVDVDFVGTSVTFDPALIANFENGTSTWTAWEVNREFNLSSTPSLEWNNPASGEILYTMEADAWGDQTGTITYFLKMDFSGPDNYPAMFWYISYLDYQTWIQSEAGDADDDGIYEVRLTDDSDWAATTVGVGYELKTVK